MAENNKKIIGRENALKRLRKNKSVINTISNKKMQTEEIEVASTSKSKVESRMTYWKWNISDISQVWHSDEMQIIKISVAKKYGTMEIDPDSIKINFVLENNNSVKCVPQKVIVKPDGLNYVIESYFLASDLANYIGDDEYYAEVLYRIEGDISCVNEEGVTTNLTYTNYDDTLLVYDVYKYDENAMCFYVEQSQSNTERSVILSLYTTEPFLPYEFVSANFYDTNTNIEIPCKLIEKDYHGEAYYFHGNYNDVELTFPDEIELPEANSFNGATIELAYDTVTLRHKGTGELINLNDWHDYINVAIHGKITIPLDEEFKEYKWEHVATMSNTSNSRMGSQVICHNGIIYLFDEFGRCFRYDAENKKIINTKMAQAPNYTCFSQVAGWEDKLYVIGGRFNDTYYNDVQIYDISTNTWSLGTPAPISFGPAYVRAIPYEGKLYIWSGDNTDSELRPQMYIYDIANDTWDTLETPSGASNYAATLIGDNIYYCGGYDQNWDYDEKMYIYNIPSNTWDYGTPLCPLDGGTLPGSCVMHGKVVQIGNRWGDFYGAGVTYNVETGEWFRLPHQTNDTMYSPLACAYKDELYLFSDSVTGRLMKLTNNPSNKEPENDYGYKTMVEEDKKEDVEDTTYNKTSWVDGNTITANHLNKIESQLEKLTKKFL